MKEPGSPRKVRLGEFYNPQVYSFQEPPALSWYLELLELWLNRRRWRDT